MEIKSQNDAWQEASQSQIKAQITSRAASYDLKINLANIVFLFSSTIKQIFK